MADFQFIAYEDQGDLLRIAINRPPYNVLDIATMEEMNAALDRAIDLDPQGAGYRGELGTLQTLRQHGAKVIAHRSAGEYLSSDLARQRT